MNVPSNRGRHDDNIERRVLAEAETFLGELTDAATRDRIELRDAVCAYFVAQRSLGAGVESIVDAVEVILRQAEKRNGVTNDSKELARQLVDWCEAESEELT